MHTRSKITWESVTRSRQCYIQRMWINRWERFLLQRKSTQRFYTLPDFCDCWTFIIITIINQTVCCLLDSTNVEKSFKCRIIASAWKRNVSACFKMLWCPFLTEQMRWRTWKEDSCLSCGGTCWLRCVKRKNLLVHQYSSGCRSIETLQIEHGFKNVGNCCGFVIIVVFIYS